METKIQALSVLVKKLKIGTEAIEEKLKYNNNSNALSELMGVIEVKRLVAVERASFGLLADDAEKQEVKDIVQSLLEEASKVTSKLREFTRQMVSGGMLEAGHA